MSESDLEKKLDKLIKQRVVDTGNHKKLSIDFAVMNTTLMKREQVRLSKKLGKDHERVKHLKQREQKIFRNLRTLQSTVREEVPEIEIAEKEAIIEGAIVDENRIGVENVRVYLADEAGNRIDETDVATTTVNGRYALKIPETLAVSDFGEDRKFRVMVESSAANKIHEEETPVAVSAGGRTKKEVRIRRAQLLRPQKFTSDES